MTPLNALGTAMLSYCGQNYGAKLYKRVKKGITTAVIIMLLMYVILLCLALLLLIDDTYLKIFYSSESISEKTSYLGRLNVLFTVPFFPFLGILFILRCSLQGIEKPLVPFLAGVGELLARTLLCSFGPYIFVQTISTSIDLYNNPGSYIVTCLADPFAWLVACIILTTGFIIYIYVQLKKKLKSDDSQENKLDSQPKNL